MNPYFSRSLPKDWINGVAPFLESRLWWVWVLKSCWTLKMSKHQSFWYFIGVFIFTWQLENQSKKKCQLVSRKMFIVLCYYLCHWGTSVCLRDLEKETVCFMTPIIMEGVIMHQFLFTLFTRTNNSLTEPKTQRCLFLIVL